MKIDIVGMKELRLTEVRQKGTEERPLGRGGGRRERMMKMCRVMKKS